MDLMSLPLFQHDLTEGRSALSRPPLRGEDGALLPERFVMCFMKDTLDAYVSDRGLSPVCVHESETADFPVYVDCVDGTSVGLVQAPVGAPAAALLMDRLIYSGAATVVSCGGCGVLEPLDSGVLVVPTCALRDEGTSYHYAPPAASIDLDQCMVDALLHTIQDLGAPCRSGMVWTCDGFFRETPNMVSLRRSQGCIAVDMEVSALAAVAQFYGARYGALLYSGDSLSDPNDHQHRDWLANHTARSASLACVLRAISYTSTRRIIGN